MTEERLPTTFEFLEQQVYLPEYMTLADADYQGDKAILGVNIREPPVARLSSVDYFTPRGLHITISQGGIALVERMIERGELEGLDIPSFRALTLQGRLKLTELHQRWRREVKADKKIKGELELASLHKGAMPFVRFNFDFADGAVKGYFTSAIARHRVPQVNAEIARI